MLYEQIRKNKQKTVAFLILFFAFIQAFGFIFGELVFDSWVLGVTIASITTIIYMLITVSNCNSVIMKMNNARKVSKDEYFELYNIVEEISLVAGLEKAPDVYVMKEQSPNAFACGLSPKTSSICCTTALLEKLNREQLEGVIAHEMAHIVGYDIRLASISLAIMSAVLILADMFTLRNIDDDTPPIFILLGVVFIILSPIIAKVMHFALSRNREYQADAMAINFTRNPVGLKDALLIIDGDGDVVDNIPSSHASLYIADPLKKQFKNGKKVKKASIFSTHPSVESRIERLDNM